MSSSLKLEFFCCPFWLSALHVQVGLRKRGGNISVDLSLFGLLYNTNFTNKLKFNDFLKTKN